MKKNKYLLGLILLFIAGLFTYRFIITSHKVDQLDKFRTNGVYDGIPMDYFNKYDKFPASLHKAFEFYINSLDQEEHKDGKEMFYSLYQDPYSDSLLKYIPLKDSLTDKYLGFILLSQGSDKMFNNNFKELNINNFDTKLNLYNEFEDSAILSYNDIYIPIIMKLIPMKKDILVYYWSIPEYYNQMANVEKNILKSSLSSFLKQHIRYRINKPSGTFISKNYLFVKINFDSTEIINNMVNFPYEEYRVNCKMLIDSFYYNNSKENICLVGLLDTIDKEKRMIYITKCLPVDQQVK